jgi:hypothetical protein
LWLARLAWALVLAGNLVLLYYLLPRTPATLWLQTIYKSSWDAVKSLVSSSAFGWYVLALYFMLLLAFLGAGLFIAWRKPSDWMALFTSAVLISLGVQYSKISASSSRFSSLPGYDWLVTLDGAAQLLCFAGLLLLIYLFPDGRMIPRRLGWIAAAIVALNFALNISPLDSGYAWAIAVLSMVMLLAGGVLSQVYRYRRVSTILQRQQVKWAVAGLLAYPLYLFIYALFTLMLRGDRSPPLIEFLNLHLGYLTLLLIPLTLGLSILRYRLWDIDVIVRRTLVYGALSLTLAIIFFGSVTLLQTAFSAVSGQTSAVATVISTLLIAALFSPLRRRIQRDIDRRFFRQKYNAEQIVEAFGGRLREQVDLGEMSAHLLAVVEQALQPEHTSLWIVPLAPRERKDKEA